MVERTNCVKPTKCKDLVKTVLFVSYEELSN